MSDSEDPEVSMLRAEVEALKAERDSALSVLTDFLEERGESWLAKLAPRKDFVLTMLERAGESGTDDRCPTCGTTIVHASVCPIAALLFEVHPRWAEWQIERAHAEALREKARREQPRISYVMTGVRIDPSDYLTRSTLMNDPDTSRSSIDPRDLFRYDDPRRYAVELRAQPRGSVAVGTSPAAARGESVLLRLDNEGAVGVAMEDLAEGDEIEVDLNTREVRKRTPSASARTGG